MKLVHLHVGSRGIDTVTPLTKEHCAFLKGVGYDFVVRYLGSLTPEEVKVVHAAGLVFSTVTYAKAWNGQQAVQHLLNLGVPRGASAFLDVEDVHSPKVTLAGVITNWAKVVEAGGYDPGGYFGSLSLLNSDEQFALPLRKYWHSCSRVTDDLGREAGPRCGWVMHQLYPPNIDLEYAKGKLLRVDVDVIQRDYGGREIAFVGAS